MTHIAVIGRGLIGSAAARHLARSGHQVTLIGPSEPENKADHDGVFGSHYDEGRITRALDPHLFWSDASTASIARYSEIEAQSGVSFFTECGAMIAGPQGGSFAAAIGNVQETRGIACERFSGTNLREAFAYLHMPDDFQIFYEQKDAGHLSPRKLVTAQTIAATRAGAQVVDVIALGFSESKSGVVITTNNGEFLADQVLVAAGGFTNMVMPQPLPTMSYARTAAFFELDANGVADLAGMPSIVMSLEDGRDPYILPPIRYPNGKYYLKIGGDPSDVPLDDANAMKLWFKSGGSAEVGQNLKQIVLDLIPNLQIKAMHTEACMTTFTQDDRPIISRQSDRVTVAVAGCGRGAKCSDELGRMAGELTCLSPK